jgi:PAS domain S-box-containing protein/diguanylate cyclase (GGDEF)-like protein
MDEAGQFPLHVLVVEDRPEDAELMIHELRQRHSIASWSRVASETEFMAALESAPDIILSDYMVPGFGALRVLEALRERALNIPVLVITGSLSDVDAAECIKLGAQDYLLKDRLARLPEAATQALEHSRLRDARLAADKALRESERLNRAIIDSSIDSIITIDQHGTIIDFNPAAERTFHVERREAIGRAVADLIIPPQYREAHRQGMARLLATGESRILGKHIELTAQRPDGTEFPVELTIAAIGSWDAPMFTAHIRDLSERKSQDAKIARLSRIQAVLTSMNSAITRVTHGQQLYTEACRIAVEHGHFGMVWIGLHDPVRQEVTPAAWAGYEIEDDWASLKGSGAPTHDGVITRAIRERRPVVVNDMMLAPTSGGVRRAKAIERGFRSVICLPFIVEGEVAGTFVLFAREANAYNEEEVRLLVQITGEISRALEHMTRRDRIAYLYHYDTLTGLPNRALLVERIAGCLEARNSKTPVGALAVLNLQRFRNVNESFGRQGGDHLLRLVARRLEGTLGGMDCVARIDADTFAVLLDGVPDSANIMAALEERVLAGFRDPFHLQGNELRVAVSIGVAAYPSDANDADTLIRNAEAALKRARTAGERYMFYSAEMNARAAHALTLETRLRNAVEQCQFVLHYQPKVSLSTGKIVGAEALIRWQDPATGLVPPTEFIPLLEETGLILEVGRWVLLKAREDYDSWRTAGIEAPRIAVNVSQFQLRQRDFVDVVREATASASTGIHGLDIEITESLIMSDVKGNIEKLHAIQQLGVTIALDDFGTGYSSLSYLAKLPVDYLKIDRSFIISMVEDPDSMAIVSTIITLAHSLKRKVIAEGVDSKDQSRLLTLLRCNEMQGYLFSKPIPADDLVRLVAQSGDFVDCLTRG